MNPITNFKEIVLKSFVPVFVSGSPRSGTSITQALICTSESVNDYVPECSFFTGVLSNYNSGLKNSLHNLDLFGSTENFELFGIEQISCLLTYLWMRLDTKRYLCLKDPYLFSYFDFISKALPNSKFIFTIRDPIETISSRVNVELKAGNIVAKDKLLNFCNELKVYYEYATLLKNKKNSLVLDYTEIINGKAEPLISDFLGLDDLKRENVWKSKHINNKIPASDPWMTNKYFKAISEDKSKIILSNEEIKVVDKLLKKEYENSKKVKFISKLKKGLNFS